MSQKAPDLPQPDTTQPHQAGETQSIPGGRITYLAPKPLSTAHDALDMNGTLNNLNKAYLDVGGGYMDAFGWQLLTGVAFGFFLLFGVIVPSLFLLTMLDASYEFVLFFYSAFLLTGLGGGGLGF
ncbi:hypothetical protein [Vreelandella sp. H-I2]